MAESESDTPVKKTAAKKTTAKKSTAKKKVAKKKVVKKKAVKKKATVKKTTAKKTAKKTTTAKKKSPVKKSTRAKKATFDSAQVGKTSVSNLKAAESGMDKAMKKMANLDVRFLTAQEKLTELQAAAKQKAEDFKQTRTKRTEQAVAAAKARIAKHKDTLAGLREKRQQAMADLKAAKTMHKAHETIVNKIEAGRKKAAIEAKKAEEAFMKRLHSLENKLLKAVNKPKKKTTKKKASKKT